MLSQNFAVRVSRNKCAYMYTRLPSPRHRASCERLRCAVADNGVDEVTTPPDGVADIGRLVTEYCPQENPESSSEESESYSALRALANRALAGVRPVVMRGVVISPVAKRPVNARSMLLGTRLVRYHRDRGGVSVAHASGS